MEQTGSVEKTSTYVGLSISKAQMPFGYFFLYIYCIFSWERYILLNDYTVYRIPNDRGYALYRTLQNKALDKHV